MSAQELMDKLPSLRVVDLKEELEKRGLSKSGSKKDLAERLRTNVQLELSQQQGAAADEAELPNISMQEKLAEQNPFIRDYFASQAEMFHSQKLAKQLIEEERLRESEASAPSADEGEDKESAGGKVKKLAKRFENQATDKENSEPSNNVESSPEKAVAEEIVEKPEENIEDKPEKNVEDKLEENVEDKPEEKPQEISEEKPEETPKEEPETSKEKAIEISEEKQEEPEEEERPVESEASTSSPSEDEVEDNAVDNNTKPNGDVTELAKKLENHATEEENSKPSKSIPSSPEKAVVVDKSIDKPEEKPKQELEEEEGPDSESEQSEASASSDDEVEEDKKSNSNTESAGVKVTELAKRFGNQATEKANSETPKRVELPKPSPEKASTDEVVAKPEKAEEGKVRRITEQFEKKSKECLNETEKSEAQEPKLEVQEEIAAKKPPTVVEKKPIEAPKRKLILAPTSEPKSRPEVSKQRRVSTRNEDIQDEDALDYGDEEKVKSEPAKFDWTRRILRLKNKHEVKDVGKKWQREVDKSTENINTEFLKQWFPEVKLVSASDLRLEEKEKSPSAEVAEDKVKIIRTFSTDSDKATLPKMENITITRKVSLIPMVPSQMVEVDADKDLSPPRNPTSELILITNLVRPFTLPQLKELLQRTGNLQDLWVDKIKSKCIAKYEKEEEAFETRAALHGVNWPQSNPKTLHVDYTTLERMNDYKSRDSGEPKPLIVEKPVTAESLPVREWDVGKRAKSRSPNRLKRRSRSVSRDRKRSRRSPSPHRRRGSRSPHLDRRARGDVKEPEPLGKALDELFRKTTATPSIYWLPLTPQQIAEKEELRRKRMVERERRLAEMNKIRPR